MIIPMKKKTTRLRGLFFGNKTVVLPGVCDSYEAKMVQLAGFQALYMSGGRTSAAKGYPDAGFLTMTEMVVNAHYIANSVDIPLLSDCDTGYGNALSVRRAIQEFIMAGVAGVHIEDQVTPKRCGFMPGKQIIGIEEAVGKLRAAVDMRNELDPDFIVMARTDAMGAVGGSPEEAVRRAEAYRKAGTDVTFIEGIKNMKELRFIAERVEKPILVIPEAIPVDERPSEDELEKMGIVGSLNPGMLQKFVNPLIWEFLHDVKARGMVAQKEWIKWLNELPRRFSVAPSLFEISGFAKVKEWEENYMGNKEMEKYQKSTGIAYGKGIF